MEFRPTAFRPFQCRWVLVLCLSMDVGSAATQNNPPIVALRELARYKATVEQCTSSNFFKQLRKTDFTYWVLDINSGIDHAINFMHDSPRGKMLFVTYNIAYRQYAAEENVTDSGSVAMKPKEEPRTPTGGAAKSETSPCNKERLADINAKVPAISNAVRNFLRS